MRIEIDLLEHLSPSERAEALLVASESQWYERKSIGVAPNVVARTFVGMANAEGGVVAIGLSNGGIEDLVPHAAKVNVLRRVPHEHCAPEPRVRFHQFAVESAGRQSEVLLADVQPGETLHETTAGECFLRVGDSTMKLNPAQREELSYDRGAAQFEARPMPGGSTDDLRVELVDHLRSALGSTLSLEMMLSARSLLTPRSELTIAAYLLLADRPQEQLPNAHVRVLRYLASDAGTGARQSVMEGGDVRVEGPILAVIDEVAARMDEWVPKRRALRADGRFGGVPVVPRDAWLEGLVNAVVHRSYSMAGDHIRVSIFPDRVEIESPGRFPGVVDPDRPLEISRYARNPRIARVCHDFGITQERGEGIKRIFDEMRQAGLVDPLYWQTSGSVRLTLQGLPRLAPTVAERLPTGAEAALRTLRASRTPLGTGEIAGSIGLARPATLRALHALRELGEIEWRGKSKKDPRATWSVAEGDLL